MLSVVNVAYPFTPVDEDPIGGAEQIVAALDRALVSRGDRSTIVGHADSRPRGRLIPVWQDGGPIDAAAKSRARAAQRAAIDACVHEGRADVVHMHGVDYLDYPDDGTPVMVTFHLRLGSYSRQALAGGSRRSIIRVCVSDTQRREAPDLDIQVIENGVPLERFQPGRTKRDFVLMLGRVCVEKGFDSGLRAARRAGIAVRISGAVFPYPERQDYFRETIAPLLAEREFLGPMTGRPKRALLAQARCLLIPSRVAETSSLVAMEALASGTPVIAFRRGALPEIVEEGYTGFIVDTEEEMAGAIAAVSALRPDDCRDAAESRFSAAAMTRAYVELYEQAAARA
ncbi:MAG TPA: glycosyltransferase [Gemmatimonadales bacterium]|nr:glycosyltransferase [Gemmatimonadales bacterium]